MALETAEARFWRFVQKDAGGCWNWTGVLFGGYGRLFLRRGRAGVARAHRFSYELLVGPIPDGLDLDHLCRNRRCVNPAHLEPVTCGENVVRSPISRPGQQVRQTHCKRGHLFDAENTHVTPKGKRHCRACDRLKANARYHRAHPGARRIKQRGRMVGFVKTAPRTAASSRYPQFAGRCQPVAQESNSGDSSADSGA